MTFQENDFSGTKWAIRLQYTFSWHFIRNLYPQYYLSGLYSAERVYLRQGVGNVHSIDLHYIYITM